MEENLQPARKELEEKLKRGEISRRDFIRSLCTLGLSLGASQILTGCSTPTPETLAAATQAPNLPAATPSTLWIYDPENPEENIPPNLPQDRSGAPDPVDGIAEFPLKETVEAPTPEPPLAEAPTAAPRPQPTAEYQAGRISWYCSVCGMTFMTSDMLRAHAGTAHGWRIPEIRQVNEPTYRQFEVGKVTAFDERNTVFSRTVWDEEYRGRLATIRPVSRDKWVEMEEKALIAGAIFVDDIAGSFHPNYYGYNGRVKKTEGLFSWEYPVGKEKFIPQDRQWMTRRIKEVAKFYGATLVGITEIDKRWIYSHTFERATGIYERADVPYRYAVMMAIEMDWSHVNQSPGLEASAAAALVYAEKPALAGSLARYIRGLGYEAVPSGNDTGQNIPLAIDAGLGELGRNGLLITPQFGPRVRLCKVLTNLPLIPDKPIDFGMQKFCEKCHSCALSCPTKAIRDEDRTTEITSISNRPGLLRWPVDVAKCYMFWRQNGSDCMNCIAVCPWALHSQRDWLEPKV
jgi:ferredoxin